jgi:hypothetical protein
MHEVANQVSRNFKNFSDFTHLKTNTLNSTQVRKLFESRGTQEHMSQRNFKSSLTMKSTQRKNSKPPNLKQPKGDTDCTEIQE